VVKHFIADIPTFSERHDRLPGFRSPSVLKLCLTVPDCHCIVRLLYSAEDGRKQEWVEYGPKAQVAFGSKMDIKEATSEATEGC